MAILLDVIERQTVIVGSRPSGTFATTIAMKKIAASTASGSQIEIAQYSIPIQDLYGDRTVLKVNK